jgi:hypothetical protein
MSMEIVLPRPEALPFVPDAKAFGAIAFAARRRYREDGFDASLAWSKRGWVFRKLAEKHLLLPASPDKEFVTGEGFDYLGRHYRLQLTDDPSSVDVKLERGRMRMPRATASECAPWPRLDRLRAAAASARLSAHPARHGEC